MRTKSAVYIAAIMLCYSAAYGVTLTFDDVPSGTVLWGSSYAYSHRVSFSEDFRVADHSDSGWGPPHSGSNVLTSVGNPYGNPLILFGYYTGSEADPDAIQTVGAYFSTEMGVMVRVTAYRPVSHEYVPVSTVVIGAPGESWNNRYVEISSTPESPFEMLEFEGVNSPDDLLGFCADDMTIVPVPEPTSLLTLGLAASGLGGVVLRRRRRRM